MVLEVYLGGGSGNMAFYQNVREGKPLSALFFSVMTVNGQREYFSSPAAYAEQRRIPLQDLSEDVCDRFFKRRQRMMEDIPNWEELL